MNNFSIYLNDNSNSLLQQYQSMYETIGVQRFLPNHNTDTTFIYDIRPEYGVGTVQIYLLQSNVLLFIYDYTLSVELVTYFELSKEYFELEYCLDGLMKLEESNHGVTTFTQNHLSISLTNDMKGSVVRPANQKYSGVSITSNRKDLASYFGSTGFGVWSKSIDDLSDDIRKNYYFGMIPSIEISNIFHQIYACRLPIESRNLYYESKIMEAFSLIVSEELLKDTTHRPTTLSTY